MQPRSDRRALTLLETLFAFALFGIVAAGVMSSLRFATHSKNVTSKLDKLQRLRIAELAIRQVLSTSTAVLHPPLDSSRAPEKGFVVTDTNNHLTGVYLGPGGELRLKRYQEDSEVLATGISRFEVRHKLRNELECLLEATTEDDKKVTVLVGGHANNHFRGERNPAE